MTCDKDHQGLAQKGHDKCWTCGLELCDIKPIQRSFTQSQLVAEASRWLIKNYLPFKTNDPDKYYERLGMLVDFVTDLVPTEKGQL